MKFFKHLCLRVQCLVVLALLPVAAEAAGISPEEVNVLFGSAPIVTQPRTGSETLDHQATMATKMLGQNNPDWNSTHPKWNAVYMKVRADTEEDMKPVRSFIQDSWGSEYKVVIAQNVDPADAKTITAYFGTDEGKRYLDFSKRIDAVMTASMPSLIAGQQKNPEHANPPLSQEQLGQYVNMCRQSRGLQISMAMIDADKPTHGKPSGKSMLGIIIAMAMQQHRPEMDELYRQYTGDLKKFTAFNQSMAQQHLFQAVAKASQQMTRKLASMTPDLSKHMNEWLSLYKQEVGTN